MSLSMCVAKWYFAFATTGGFIFKGCQIMDHSHENLKHWGLSWMYSIELPSWDHLFIYFSQVCPLGSLHFFTSEIGGSDCSWTWILKAWLCILNFPFTLNLFLPLHNRPNDTRHCCPDVAERASVECTYMYTPFELWRLLPWKDYQTYSCRKTSPNLGASLSSFSDAPVLTVTYLKASWDLTQSGSSTWTLFPS